MLLSGKAMSISGNTMLFSGKAMSVSGNAMLFSGKAMSISGNTMLFSGKAMPSMTVSGKMTSESNINIHKRNKLCFGNNIALCNKNLMRCDAIIATGVT